MNYEKELRFAEKLLNNFRLNISYITKSTLKENSDRHEFGLQDILNYKYNAKGDITIPEEYLKEIEKMEDKKNAK